MRFSLMVITCSIACILKCLGSEIAFSGGQVWHITNSFNGHSFFYDVDRRGTNAAAGQFCNPSSCTVDFKQPIQAALNHVEVYYLGLYDTRRSGSLVIKCELMRMDFAEHWCFIIKIAPLSGGLAGILTTVDIPVMMDGTIPFRRPAKTIK